MAHRPQHRPVDENFIRGEVELHLRHVGIAIGAAVGDPPLGRRLAAPVLSPLERSLVEYQVDTRLLQEPLRDLTEDSGQLVRLLRPPVNDREVEILREAKRLVVALAQTGPSLEDPGAIEGVVVGDPGEQPAEDVVPLDDALVEGPLGAQRGQLSLRDHEAPSRITVTFARSPQRMTRRPPAGPLGSRGEMPDERRA